VNSLKIKIPIKNMRKKPTNTAIINFSLLIMYGSSYMFRHYIALGTLPEDGNVMPKHVGDTIHN
jgi:hypothetical protein